MDDNEKGGWKIPRQVPYELGQRLNAARRRADGDYVVLRHKASLRKIKAIQGLDMRRPPALNAFDQPSCIAQEGGRVQQELTGQLAQLMRTASEPVASAAKRARRR